ncbi:hypothetical protein CEXT_532881 [Caerostris extrusa]|uniref:Prospero domain-containing protein n=1 Tax=Caerostris extrusa TaxID=172846 RepID=A0AAV4XEB7_CAEEX|nr:hypothetical protein CEXT_532881 [Caerostris extrusa]
MHTSTLDAHAPEESQAHVLLRALPELAVLKMYFPDIRFNKNNTAQLVKWFSNFRCSLCGTSCRCLSTCSGPYNISRDYKVFYIESEFMRVSNILGIYGTPCSPEYTGSI